MRIVMRFTTCCAAAVVVGAASSATAGVLNVPDEYPTIQAAIVAAVPGDTVLVADGLYTGDGNRDVSFMGKDITVRSVNGPKNCIIDCEGTIEEPHRGFVFESEETNLAVLDGFTITNGTTLVGAVADPFNGGGVLCTNGSWPTISNCVFENNSCACWGGAVYGGWFSNGTIRLINCTMKGNYSGDDGGAVFSVGASIDLESCLFVGNEAATEGGALCTFANGAITLRNVTMVGNIALNGSAIFGSSGVTITNSIIRDNIGSPSQVTANPNITYTNINGVVGEGNIDADPRFLDARNGDYRLRYDSPAIDAGDPATVVAPGETDLEGDLRLLGNVIDMGADETHRLGDVNGDDAVSSVDLLALLMVWGSCPPGDCPEDFNNDGEVGTSDLLTVLANWG